MPRDELKVPKLDPNLFKSLRELISKVVYGMDDPTFDPTSDIAEISRLSGRADIAKDWFYKAYDMADDGDFARELALGIPPRLTDMTRYEIAAILSKMDTKNDRYYHRLLERAFPGVFDTDLIYWPLREMTHDETADELLHRQKIFETGGNEALVTYLRLAAEAVRDNPDAPIWAQMGASSILDTIRLPTVLRL